MKKLFSYYQPHFKIIIYIVVFIVCFGLAILLFSSGSQKKATLPGLSGQNVQISPDASDGLMLLSSKQVNYRVGQEFEITVSADSSGRMVNGYDLLFLYDPAVISVVRVDSVDPTFDVFTFNNPNFVSVTGTKKLLVSAETAFTNTRILTITLRGNKAGVSPVVIAPQLGREKTKMVDNAAQIMYPRLGQSVQLTIQ